MSAETLRRAAALMRERAEAATPGPWVVGPYHQLTSVLSHDGGLTIASVGAVRLPFVEADAAHIASWHPAVALAVADWLTFIADARESIDAIAQMRSRNGAGWLTATDPASRVFRDMEEHALTVARAYLGESS